MQGEFDHARAHGARASRSIFEELGLQTESGPPRDGHGSARAARGQPRRRRAELRTAYDALDAVGETFALSTVAGFLAQTLLEQGDARRGDRVLRTEPRADDRGGRRDAGAVALRPRHGSSRGRGRRPRPRRSPERRSSCSSRRTRSCTRSRPSVALGEALVAGGRIDEARDGLRGARAPRGDEGRRRDPHRRTPPTRGSRRRPDDERERLGHQFHGPFVSDVATIVQILGAWVERDRDDASRVRRRRAHVGSGQRLAVVEDLLDLVPFGSAGSVQRRRRRPGRCARARRRAEVLCG